MREDDRLGPSAPGPLIWGRDVVPDPGFDPGSSELETYSSLRAYWRVLSKRRWDVVGTLAGVVLVVAIYSFRMTPVYRATARLAIEADTPQISSLNEYDRDRPTGEAFLKTQVKVLESDDLAWQTIQQLGLTPDLSPATQGTRAPERARDSPAVQGLAIGEFRERLTVLLDPGTHMVEVSFESTDADLAARVANGVVRNYLEYNFHQRYEATRQASQWMEQQLDELKAKVEASQQALVDYERANAIVNVSGRQNVAEERLVDLSKDLTTAESDRAQKESEYNLVKFDPAHAALLAENPLLEQLEAKYADAKAEYAEARDISGANFPKVIQRRDRVNELQAVIDRERRHVVERVEKDYQAALNRQRLLAAAVNRQKAEVGNLNQRLIQHNILAREFDTNQQLYASLLERQKDATVAAGLRATNIHLVDAARPPPVPVRPRKVRDLAVSVLVGIVLGMTLAFARAGLENETVKTAEDVERLVRAPCLALIPGVTSAAHSDLPARRTGGNGSGDGIVALTLLKQPASPLAESYRALRSAILFSAAPRPQILLVTSARPGEGKTSIAVNLGLALAQNGARVLLIDSDLRIPAATRALGLSNERGLAGVLTGAYGLDEAIECLDSPHEFWVLPAGPRAPNPAELLSSASMGRLLGESRPRFDHVVLDSPPLLPVTDATILSTLTDGVVLVVESGVTPPRALIEAYRILRGAGAKVLGVVMNKVDRRRNGYDYSSYQPYCKAASREAEPHL